MLNVPLFIEGMLGLGDNIYQRAFVKQLPAGTYIRTAWPELYEDLPVLPVRSFTTLRTQRKNEYRTQAASPAARYAPDKTDFLRSGSSTARFNI